MLERGVKYAQLDYPYEDYWVTPDGLVWSDKSQRWLNGYKGPNGYIYYTFYDNKRFYAHRLVCHCYLGLDLVGDKRQVNHNDFDRSNNYYLNLSVVSIAENNKHAHTNPNRSVIKSYPHPNGKLTKEQAIEIYNSQLSQKKLAAEYGVSSRTIHNIKHGVRYGWATKEETVHAPIN